MLHILDVRNATKDAITSGLECGYTHIFLHSEQVAYLETLARVHCYTTEEYTPFTITTKEDEVRAVEYARTHDFVVINAGCAVIPLENIIAQNARVALCVNTIEQYKVATGILEKGVYAVLVPADMISQIDIVKKQPKYVLSTAKIIAIEPSGMADRVCIDTTSLFSHAEGILVGNTSSLFFLIHAETEYNTYVGTRPFRVNAGSVHSYCIAKDNRTYYLSELVAGTELIACNAKGDTRTVVVGRVKIERRPMLQITVQYEERMESIFLQNAETIHLVTDTGKPKSVVALQKNDTILVWKQQAGRHFGMPVEESILEK